jgi:hypothetical protein
MKDLIREILRVSLKRGKSLKVVQRFLRLRHRINADIKTLKRRKNGLREDL